jgi:hypothetical protein
MTTEPDRKARYEYHHTRRGHVVIDNVTNMTLGPYETKQLAKWHRDKKEAESIRARKGER